jgi:hypothetical protein
MSAPSVPEERVTLWPPGRQAVAAVAVLAALLTSVGGAALGADQRAHTLAVAHLALAGLAIRRPPAVAGQVAAGVVLAWLVLPGTDSPNAAVVPVMTGVVATAELLGLTARLGTVLASDPVPGLRRAAVAAVGSAAVTGAAVAAGALAGVGGLLATVVACLACLALIALVGDPKLRS